MIHRRDFLILGSAATLSVAAGAVSAGPLTMLKSADPFLSIGFAEIVSGAASPVASADRLRSGDSRFLTTDARVTIHGLWRPEARKREPIHVGVSAFFTAGEQRLPFMAWSHAGTSSAAPIRFKLPADAAGNFTIGIERATRSPIARLGRRFGIPPSSALDVLPDESALAASGHLCSLAAGADRALKLRKGAYFIALLDKPSGAPNWNALSAGSGLSVRGESILRRGEAPVDFDYLVISVDHA